MYKIKKNKNSSIKNITLLSIFASIELVFCFTPLGTLPLPGIAATMGHIPVIISAFVLDLKYSTIMGFVMGISSFIWWSTIGIGNPIAFGFTPFALYGNIFSMEICLLPRILIPIITSVFFDFFRRNLKKNLSFSAALSAIIASFCHSLLVLGQIFIVFSGNQDISEELKGSVLTVMIIPSIFSAIAEIIIAMYISIIIIKPLNAIQSIKK